MLQAGQQRTVFATVLSPLASRLRGRGPKELLRLALLNARMAARSLSSHERTRRRADQAFDRRWGTETSTGVSVHALGVEKARLAYCRRYDPSSEAMLREPLAALSIAPADFAFVDYGAGKGRVLMLALEDGFADVSGVEISARLCAVARSNVAHFAAQHEGMSPARIVQGDAADFAPNGCNILAYFYNPFDRPIMDQVRQRLESRLSAGSEKIVVIYANPEHGSVFTDAGWEEGPSTPAARTFLLAKSSVSSDT